MTYYNLPLTVPRRLMLFNVFVVKVETSNKIYRCICLNTSYITSVPKGLTGLVCSRSTWLEFACPANQHPQSTVKKVKEKKRKEKKVKEKKSKRSKKKKRTVVSQIESLGDSASRRLEEKVYNNKGKAFRSYDKGINNSKRYPRKPHEERTISLVSFLR